MAVAGKEITFENEVCEQLVAGGWLYSKDDTGYDAKRALFPEDLVGWLHDTQPKQLAKVLDEPGTANFGDQLNDLLNAVETRLKAKPANGGGTLNLLRKPIGVGTTTLKFCQAKPTESNNPEVMDAYGKVRLRVMRQVHYSATWKSRSIDLVLFCNGIPVATIELKTDFTQSVVQGEVQYGMDRLPGDPGTKSAEPLLTWGRGALVHFVVTNSVVAMTTKLDGPKTVFLPFNRGDDDGAGNPANPDGNDTDYFWDRILERDMFIKILTKYMLVKTEMKIDPATGTEKKSTSIRFPRYHQLDAVEAIVEDAFDHGAGQKYLIEHSAGSGKTDTIVWTAHRLAALHDASNVKVFDSVIVVTDRNVLDTQMTDAMLQIEHDTSHVISIDPQGDSKSHKFGDALKAKTPIIIVTIQTAPFAVGYLQDNAIKLGGRFAVIADEAHSSQTGDAAAKLREILTPEEVADLDDGGEVSSEDILAAKMSQRADAPNISYLAFTATPKAKTLELFGRKPAGGGKKVSFHLYTMRQAIQEGFILDVLTNFTPYKVAWKVAHNGAEYDENTVDKSQAVKSVMRWVRLHPYNITQKVAIIVEHFRHNVAAKLDGNAKAMVVTGSRKEAVRYFKALESYIAKQGYTDLHALVAFSGSLTDETTGPDPVSELSLNTGLHRKTVDRVFNGPDYQVLIVANKYQVGFDQPLLCAMYVDKRLAGVMAVQTLSRLNRTYGSKSAEDVFVLDFVNDGAQILDAFVPYYKGAKLGQASDINLPHLLASKLDQQNIYAWEDVEKATREELAGKNGKLHGATSPSAHTFDHLMKAAIAIKDRNEEERLLQFRTDLDNYVHAYSFLSQIVDYDNPDLEKRYIFYRRLAAILTTPPEIAVVDLTGIELTHHKIAARTPAALNMETGQPTPLDGMIGVGSAELHDPNNARWSEIMDAINDLFSGSNLSDADKLSGLQSIIQRAKQDESLVAIAKANSDDDFAGSNDAFDALIQAILGVAESTSEVTDTLLSGKNRQRLMKAMTVIGLRAWLTGDAA